MSIRVQPAIRSLWEMFVLSTLVLSLRQKALIIIIVVVVLFCPRSIITHRTGEKGEEKVPEYHGAVTTGPCKPQRSLVPPNNCMPVVAITTSVITNPFCNLLLSSSSSSSPSFLSFVLPHTSCDRLACLNPLPRGCLVSETSHDS